MPIQCVCCICGISFTVPPSQIKYGNGHHCSMQCVYVSRKPQGTLHERLYAFLPEELPLNTCWIWQGPLDGQGYGRISQGRKSKLRAYRVSYALHIGPIPSRMHVLHCCPGGGTRACVNPCHLYLGTQIDNNADTLKAGHVPHGEQHHSAKLVAEDIVSIRQRAASGESYTHIARSFLVSPSAIGQIVLRRIWKHIP